MRERTWLVLAMAACGGGGGDPKLEYEMKSSATTAQGPATWDQMKDVGAKIEVSGPDDDAYLSAIRNQVAEVDESGRIMITVGRELPSEAGTFTTTVRIDALWWALPTTLTATDTLGFTIEHAKKSRAEIGRVIGTAVAGRLRKLRPENVAVPVPTTSPATAVAVGDRIACSLHADKTVHCWGYQLGNLVGAVPSPSPIEGAVELAAGHASVCARLETGDVHCLGAHGGAGKDAHGVRPVCGVERASRIAAGMDTACAIVDGGAVRCWDTGVGDATGPSCTGKVHEAKAVRGVLGATAIASGAWGSCALLAGGKSACWQHGSFEAKPTTLPSGVDVLVGFDPCVVERSGQITCDRARDAGATLVTAKVAPGTEVVLGPMWACGIGSDAALSCWGVIPEDLAGGDTAPSTEPKPVLAGVVSAGLATTHSCAVTSDGVVRCHGLERYPTGLPADAATPTALTIY
jgi:hypothetical protein